MRIELPFPHKVLWPNGRTRDHRFKAAEAKKHKRWAYLAALEADNGSEEFSFPVPITIHVHAKPKGPMPDKDNCVAAAKNFLDGIADAIGINDRDFDTPIVRFASPREGRFVVEVG